MIVLRSRPLYVLARAAVIVLLLVGGFGAAVNEAGATEAATTVEVTVASRLRKSVHRTRPVAVRLRPRLHRATRWTRQPQVVPAVRRHRAPSPTRGPPPEA